jgi:hypothetical protein
MILISGVTHYLLNLIYFCLCDATVMAHAFLFFHYPDQLLNLFSDDRRESIPILINYNTETDLQRMIFSLPSI